MALLRRRNGHHWRGDESQEGEEKNAGESQRRLVPPGSARYHHFGRGRASARRTAAADGVDVAAPQGVVGNVVLR